MTDIHAERRIHELEEQLRQLALQVAAADWQPIATAPRDRVIAVCFVLSEYSMVSLVQWTDDPPMENCNWAGMSHFNNDLARCWLNIPPLPKARLN